jgi:L-amino acid N-acyltransferase YncA
MVKDRNTPKERVNMDTRPIQEEDWTQIKEIYELGIGTKKATFETHAPATFEKWISAAVRDASMVAVEGDRLLGWCKLSKVSDRCVYAGVGEVSIYIHPLAQGQGVGGILLQEVIIQSERLGYWTLQAGIFPENQASIMLHKKYGFRELGRRERVGKLDSSWKDVLLFERRSKVVGID